MPNPYQTLGVPPGAGDADIHRAYLVKVRESPPERDPQAFQAVRRAYEAIKTRRLRLAYELFNGEPPVLDEILARGLRSASPGRPDEEQLRRVLLATLTCPAPATTGPKKE